MRVRLLPDAERDLHAVQTYVQAEYTSAGSVWYDGLIEDIQSLGSTPYRGARVPERGSLRQIRYGKGHNVYSIFYRVNEGRDEVIVVQVLHGLRKRYLR